VPYGGAVSLIETTEAATRLARAIAADIVLYNEELLVAWFDGGSLPPALGQALQDGFGLFARRVSPALAAGGGLFLTTLSHMIAERCASSGRPPPILLEATLERVLGLPSGRSSPGTSGPGPSKEAQDAAVAAPMAAAGGKRSSIESDDAASRPVRIIAHDLLSAGDVFTVPAAAIFGAGTLTFLAGAFVFERAIFGGAKERTEYAYDAISDLRVARAASGWELSVRVQFLDVRWTLTTTDALAVARHLLPLVVRDT
jgi:hypothetical protein